MITGFLSLLCLGLCLGSEEEKNNEHLPKPSLSASPSTAAEPGSNVTLKCQSHFQNVTFMLGKWQDSGYRQEQSSAGPQAEFLLTGLAPPDSGSYFCAYKRVGSQVWSEKSGPLQLVVADYHDGHRALSRKKATRIIFVTTVSCMSILLLFLSVFFIYRCSQHDPSHEEVGLLGISRAQLDAHAALQRCPLLISVPTPSLTPSHPPQTALGPSPPLPKPLLLAPEPSDPRLSCLSLPQNQPFQISQEGYGKRL
ncbi:V-Set And Transmembrane Domain-Containing Protein 1 [Manis pentadactyla]|nr:V-Set And Transmembrane Domain-Containing Protein 1 [Manis pentadactyla]